MGIAFFHGLEGSPQGTKATRLRNEFEGILIPDFRGMDLKEAVAFSERLTSYQSDLVIVGSSYGGLIASLLYQDYPNRIRGLVLMAPAFSKPEAIRVKSLPPTHILHGRYDDVVPLEDVLGTYQALNIRPHIVDDGHRLHTALDLMCNYAKSMATITQDSSASRSA